MLTNHMIASDAAKRLSERAGRIITVDDLRQMRRHGHIEGETLENGRTTVYTPEQIEAATIPVARKSPEKKPQKKKRGKRKVKPI